MRVNHSARSGGIIGKSFRFSEGTLCILIIVHTTYHYQKKTPKIIPNTLMFVNMVFLFLLGTQERVRNSRGKRAISVPTVIDFFCLHLIQK